MKKVWVVVILSGFWLSGCEKWSLDKEVRRLCAQDGGTRIYEIVTLPPEQFNKYVNKYGEFRLPTSDKAAAEDKYVHEWRIQYYQKGNPEMWRSQFVVIRRSDNKILAETVIYSRRGGDMPGPWHDSSFSCPSREKIKDIQNEVFKKR